MLDRYALLARGRSSWRGKRQSYAAAMNHRVVRVLRVSEKSRQIDPSGSIVVTGALRDGLPLEPGEVSTSVTIYVDFALAPASASR